MSWFEGVTVAPSISYPQQGTAPQSFSLNERGLKTNAVYRPFCSYLALGENLSQPKSPEQARYKNEMPD